MRVGFNNDDGHQNSATCCEYRGELAVSLVIIPSCGYQYGSISHAYTRADQLVYQPAFGNCAQNQRNNQQETDCGKAGQESIAPGPVKHFVGKIADIRRIIPVYCWTGRGG